MLMLVSSLVLSGCVDSLHSQPPPPKWATGFWYWHGDSTQPASAKETPDVLYVHAGRIWKSESRSDSGHWYVDASLPNSLPQAREYWLVFRAEQQGVPDLSVAPMVTREALRLVGGARERRLKVVGVQLDIDSPTADLAHYAEFLGVVRKSMPAGLELSITALLDWFRDGTSIADAIKATDEFVPQFYDVAPPGSFDEWRAIASKIDAARWATRFNRLGKRYRVGISTFGRGRLVPRQDASQAVKLGVGAVRLYSDLTPIDLAGNQSFEVQASHTAQNELELKYRAIRKVVVGYNQFQPGDTVEFTTATADSVRSAVESARKMQGNCAGVVFFRWPAANEYLVMQPDEVLAAGGLGPQHSIAADVDVVDGQCAAVSCVDLYLVNGNPLASRAVLYRIRSSVELDYFLPQERVPVRLAGPSILEVSLPPYGGQGRMLLGRAVTKVRAEFHIEEAR